jgi:hypothetical protein
MQFSEFADEAGIPFFGNSLEALKPDYQDTMFEMFEKHKSSAIRFNLGPYGQYLAVETAQDIYQVMVENSSRVVPRFPSTFMLSSLQLFFSRFFQDGSLLFLMHVFPYPSTTLA